MKNSTPHRHRLTQRSWPRHRLAAAAALLAALVAAGAVFWTPAEAPDHDRSDLPRKKAKPTPSRFDASTRRFNQAPSLDTQAQPPLATDETRPGEKVAEEREALDGPTAPGLGDPGPGPHIEHYQGRSGRLSPSAAIGGSRVPVQSSSSEQGPVLLVQAPAMRVNAGEALTLSATLLDERGKQVAAQAMDIAIFPHVDPSARVEAAMTRSGGEHRFEFHAPPPAERGARAPEQYEFVVRAQGPGYQRSASGLIFVQQPSAKLEPSSSRVERSQGDIGLDVTVEVQRAGNYFASAELWGGAAADQPIAFARQRLERVGEGAQRISLLFGGKVIRDSGVDGPYVVRNVQLLSVDTVPPHQSEPIAELDPTPAWRATDFY